MSIFPNPFSNKSIELTDVSSEELQKYVKLIIGEKSIIDGKSIGSRFDKVPSNMKDRVSSNEQVIDFVVNYVTGKIDGIVDNFNKFKIRLDSIPQEIKSKISTNVKFIKLVVNMIIVLGEGNKSKAQVMFNILPQASQKKIIKDKLLKSFFPDIRIGG